MSVSTARAAPLPAGMLVIAASYSFAQVFVGRVVCGLGVGLGFAICPQYIAEISPAPWRGFLVSMFEISINLGLCAGRVWVHVSSTAFN